MLKMLWKLQNVSVFLGLPAEWMGRSGSGFGNTEAMCECWACFEVVILPVSPNRARGINNIRCSKDLCVRRAGLYGLSRTICLCYNLLNGISVVVEHHFSEILQDVSDYI